MNAKRLSIRGRVQGVGYRISMVDAACDCGVVGWVRNRRDGSVEALVQGTPEAVAGIVAWAQHGPLAAVVSDVAETEVPVDAALRDFLSLPTA